MTPEHPGLPCTDGLTVYFVLFPGSDALLPPSPCKPRAPRTGRCEARPQGLTPASGRQNHTTSPSAHISVDFSMGGVRSPSRPTEDAVSAVSYRAACRSRSTLARIPALQRGRRADAIAATASRPASRDDRETPLGRAEVVWLLHQSRNSVNKNTLLASIDPRLAWFARPGNTRAGRPDGAACRQSPHCTIAQRRTTPH